MIGSEVQAKASGLFDVETELPLACLEKNDLLTVNMFFYSSNFYGYIYRINSICQKKTKPI